MPPSNPSSPPKAAPIPPAGPETQSAAPQTQTTTIHTHQGPVGVDEDFIDDGDSAIGDDDMSSYSTSLVSSVLSKKTEYGRNYHAYVKVLYSSGDVNGIHIERDRLDMTHHIFKIMLHGKLYEAPITKDVQRVLDVGCGTGLWAVEFADDFPSAQVLGIDLQPIQTTLVPPNLKFEIDDVEDEFPYKETFDFIHCRYLAYSIKDWPRLVKQIYKHTTPGGYAEFLDYDLDYKCDDGSLDNTLMKDWVDNLPRAGRMMGRDPSPGPSIEPWMREAGFTNIVHKKYILPVGPWPKDKHLKMLGAYNHIMVSEGAEAFTLRLFIKVLGWSHEEVQVLLPQVKKELKNKKIHSYIELHKVWGQKPEAPAAV
ncbi:hypothetical protein AJ80_07521 [Polytolypa hystricis UAMH7299]|uniref:Methyltransferase domain-containing protein n=1 Tax=Polytolypa hystricis (strain UAMH7299) TaxID=1447883 RepID=A0A2B7XPF2_POLH7|nr:hypothetical protein AJ80_07521 [Polytolypa hystricis UAMH7299]